jgi:hypothetical protein
MMKIAFSVSCRSSWSHAQYYYACLTHIRSGTNARRLASCSLPHRARQTINLADFRAFSVDEYVLKCCFEDGLVLLTRDVLL